MKRGTILYALLALAASLASAHDPRIRAENLPACVDNFPTAVWIVNSSSATTCDSTSTGTTEAHCCCANGAWAACGGSGGSGDIESVWTDTTGDVSALTAAAGDSLDCGSADACSPATRSTSLPGTCAEGQVHQDTDSGGSETYVCTATNTWTKLDAGTCIIFDIGDDGGNDSICATELATENDDYGAIDEESADKVRINFSKIPPFRQYHPDRPPSSCATCDEFTGDAATLTFTSAGNTDVTQSYVLDAMRLRATGDSTAIDKYIITTAAPSGSWVASAKVTVDLLDASGNPTCGLLAITSGTQAAPTGITFSSVILQGGTAQAFAFRSATSLTAAPTTYGTPEDVVEEVGAHTHYLQIRYDATADTLTGCLSTSGWPALVQCEQQTSVTSDPPYIGFMIDDLTNLSSALSVECFFHFLRVRTDGTGTADPYPIGE